MELEEKGQFDFHWRNKLKKQQLAKFYHVVPGVTRIGPTEHRPISHSFKLATQCYLFIEELEQCKKSSGVGMGEGGGPAPQYFWCGGGGCPPIDKIEYGGLLQSDGAPIMD